MNPTRVARRLLARAAPEGKALQAVEMSASARIILASPVFDRAWYERQTGRSFRSRAEAVWHYVRRGRGFGFSPNRLFEPEWYAPEQWRTFRADPLARYLIRERAQDRAPHPMFDPAAWRALHPAAAKHPGGTLAHFLATATDDTIMPVVAQAEGLVRTGEVTWGEVRRRTDERLAAWHHQEALRKAERVVFAHDDEADAAYVRRWSAAPLPDTGDRPVVSIVLPVLDRATSVLTAIASVRAQTLTDWELLVVDDGSTDASAEVVELVAAQDARVRLLRGDHAGVSAARNRAAAAARGHYVAWLDSDNAWEPHFLQTAVAALHGGGHRGGFSSLEMVSAGRRSWRSLQGTLEMMDVGNHVDLNVLVVERSLLEQVGGFDETLRRTVDYDLAWRLWKAAPLVHLPFVGVTYADDRDDADRISNRELKSWTEVVKNRHLIDWAAQERDLALRVQGRTSLLVPTWRDFEMTWRMALSVLHAADALPVGALGSDVEVIVLDNGSQRATGQLLEMLATLDPRVRYVRTPVNTNFGLGSNLAFAHSTGEVVLFLNNDTEVREGWLPPLLAALDDPAVLGAQPLLTYPGGVVQCAGLTFPEHGTFPYHFLQNHPAEDVRRLGESFEVEAVTGAALAMRPADVIALQGFEPLFVNGQEDVDLCLRLIELRRGAQPEAHFAVVPPSQVTHYESMTPGRGLHTEQNRTLFHQRWAGRTPPGDERLWRRAGFEVAHYWLREDRGYPGHLRIPQPTVVRPPSTVADGPAAGLPSLRWAVKIAAPEAKGREWGDLHFATALAAALERLGQQVAVDFREAAERPTQGLDDVVLVLRGLDDVRVQPGRVNLLWVISHPELVTPSEMRAYDQVFAASLTWAAKAGTALGRPVLPLLQATDAHRFHPGGATADTGHPVLFLGNSRKVYRPVVRHLVEAGVDVAVYGSLWDSYIPSDLIRGTHVANAEVPAMYRTSGVVLNDHWEDMRVEGFLSNRLFDAAAVGARVVSDDVPGTEVFGGLVRTYRTPAELVALVAGAQDAFPDEQRRLELAEVVRREHSFDARARELLEHAVRLHAGP